MAIAHSTDKIIIIGAGPGGLVLAHCLRKHGIPYEIFEREKASQPRKQGWAVALIESLPDLEASLPAEVFQRLPTASVNRNMDSNDIFSIIDGKTGNVTAAVGGEDYPSSRCLLRVNRQAFRQVLCEGIKVQNDKELDYYEEFEDGVLVHFKDGTSTTGSLLVGADGAHSAVRKQLYKSAKLSQSSFFPLAAEIRLSKEQYEPLHKIGSAGLFSYGKNLRYLIGLLSVSEDRSSALYYWACCIRSDTPEKEWEWVRNATSEQLHERCANETRDFAPYLTDIIRLTKPETMVQPPVRFFEFTLPEEPSGSERVTLLGDAAHVMVPFYLAGANTAVRDACDLARCIVGNPGDSSSLIREYEDRMLTRGRQMVLRSRKAGQDPTLDNIVVRANEEGSGILW
ncbi:hypothetical protein ASPVEDRAFT_79902 [Aspergillus versicolor CBS 583.65]|uniref:FAD-binding domain-containing protein n=1 Tax=Aspergillus versicolor CBS 583.65 TaxID=1036611 RepID=A0A1L9P9R1_ASPVE|nr:uncharacterized protein ASPVEDRAFT_79902 [Aspergillus versicolor CBS 583.65]OJI98236.1 hypothetical protein ASPVEDRAFT_79902 [Aspergillus versicolor CBS 583.65]